MTSHRAPSRLLPTLVSLALVPGSLLVLAQAPASAAPLPATFSAGAHADILHLDARLMAPVTPGSLADVRVGHSRSGVTSTGAGGSSTASSANLDGSALFGGVPLSVDTETVTAPPSVDPPARSLVNVPLAPVADVGVITGDVRAAWDGSNVCVPASAGTRLLSEARTTLAGVTLADAPVVGALAKVTASHTRTSTALVDDSVGGSDVLSRATTTVGDIDLLGDRVSVDVTNPVVLQARSDGTTGSAGFVSPPTIVVTVDGNTIPVPLNSQPQKISLPTELELLADLTITAFTPTQQSSGTSGKATLDALLRIDLEVLSLPAPLGATVADVSLAVAPMAVEATAPSGGVECGASDSTAPDVPVIVTPADGSSTDDSTPTFSGTAEPGSTVIVRDPAGGEVCTTVADPTDGTWSCTPNQPLPQGQNTYTATATDGAGNESGTDTTTFTIDTTDPAVAVLTPANGSSTTDVTPDVTGTGEPGAAIVVREGGTTICTATVSGAGTWACTPTVPLLPGSHTFTVTAADAAGNTADATTTFTVVVDNGDTTAPGAPDITAPANGSSVQDTTPPISGTGETGATVTVREGTTVLCTAVVSGAGTWSCSPTVPLPLGPHTVTATQTDAAGNTGPADSATFTVVAGGGNGDSDGDGLPDGQEGPIGTNPNDPDTDDDGLTDGQEVNTYLTDPLDADTDNDGIKDGQEVTGSKIRERFEVCGRKVRKSITVTTNPLVKDTDKDGLTDGREINGYKIKQRVKLRDKTITIGKTRTNPRKKDTDRDGLKDKVEKTGKANKAFGKAKSDPTKCDTDKGGVSDGKEIRARSNPINVLSGPRMPGTRSGRSVTDGLRGGLG